VSEAANIGADRGIACGSRALWRRISRAPDPTLSAGDVGEAAVAGRLAAAGIDPKRRPQTLSLVEWETLYRAFE